MKLYQEVALMVVMTIILSAVITAFIIGVIGG